MLTPKHRCEPREQAVHTPENIIACVLLEAQDLETCDDTSSFHHE